MLTLQSLLMPDPEICTDAALFFRSRGGCAVSHDRSSVTMAGGAQLAFDTFFNLFSLTKWHEACALDGLIAEIEGEGRVGLRAVLDVPDQSPEVLHSETVTLAAGRAHVMDLSHYPTRSVIGLVYLEVVALGREGARIDGGRFATRAQPQDWPALTISITTFRREVALRGTIERLARFLDTYAQGEHIRLQVVDNGGTAHLPDCAHTRVIENPNYGGAAGFARGLIEAEAEGATHCLFMDDDAAFPMENIARAHVFLALARDPATAVAGAMITNTQKTTMWEYGAWFNGSCRPLFSGTDLRKRHGLRKMEHSSAETRPETLYGGWWFFAFPLAPVRHMPFPFFVRGDDINFSLMNPFRIYTLNGVVSFQDDFTEKESPLTLYLDLRNHLVQHLVTPSLARGGFGTARIALYFVLRSLIRLHYETADAQLLAWEDVMQGPQFFVDNIDMADRRAVIAKMSAGEFWQDRQTFDLIEEPRLTGLSKDWRRRIALVTLNGHLLPFASRLWGRIVVRIGRRSAAHAAFCAADITFVNSDGTKAYRVRHSKRRFFGRCLRMTGMTLRYMRQHARLRRAYRDAYGDMTSKAFWKARLDP
jgi:galactofuranosylgalactofuranosylrhamnosyl-N-acetylglucosaminyl-diphospho-decaprenol beta-1,5/1,6-galactofuranosyltransferase